MDQPRRAPPWWQRGGWIPTPRALDVAIFRPPCFRRFHIFQKLFWGGIGDRAGSVAPIGTRLAPARPRLPPPPSDDTGNSPTPGQPTPGVVKQDKSSRGSGDTTKTRSDHGGSE